MPYGLFLAIFQPYALACFEHKPLSRRGVAILPPSPPRRNLSSLERAAVLRDGAAADVGARTRSSMDVRAPDRCALRRKPDRQVSPAVALQPWF
jgi:hypothetical protein